MHSDIDDGGNTVAGTTAAREVPVADIDRWRAGLLDAERARAVERAVRADTALAKEAAFGTRVAHSLAVHLDAHFQAHLRAQSGRHRATHGHALARRVRWPRLIGAGVATASLAMLILTLAMLVRPPVQPAAPGALSPQIADAVQNLDFYQWLAEHPQALEEVRHDGPA